MLKFWLMVTFLTTIITFSRGQGSEILNAETETFKEWRPADGRTFRINYDTNEFEKDGQTFRYVSGSFHYFRSVPEAWQRKLRTMRAAGLNAVSTYVEWSLHNPTDGNYNWTGIADLVEFIRLAEKEDLLVILRPGPYICAERDMGGFPYWLLHKYPGIKLRTLDNDYVYEATKWYDVLMAKMEPLFYENGGPIIMVSVENEYGSYGCDVAYRNWTKAMTERYVQDKAVLFTNDGPSQSRCGKIDGVLATLDFGQDTNVDKYWEQLRKVQPNGPLVNSEYYPGWLSHWQETFARVPTQRIVNSFKQMMDRNASVNFYMFYGGTNFGYTAGANDDNGPREYMADLTSYDYDAPMDEAGDPTKKYYAIRNAIGTYLPLPNVTFPVPEEKMDLDPVQMQAKCVLLSAISREKLGSTPVVLLQPTSFEALNQYSGFVLYETTLPTFSSDPGMLRVNKLHDRAYVYVDRHFVGILSRENKIDQLPLAAETKGARLQLFVENQGRLNYHVMNDFKGILGAVKINERTLFNWTMTGFPLDNYNNNLERLVDVHNSMLKEPLASGRSLLRSGPTIFSGLFQIDGDKTIRDTYLDMTGWGKGIVFINGFNLGRYWPIIGPQITLYVPKELLKRGENKLTLVELQRAPYDGRVTFTKLPILDAYPMK